MASRTLLALLLVVTSCALVGCEEDATECSVGPDAACSGKILVGRKLKGLEMPRIDLSKANVAQVEFQRAKMPEANLKMSNAVGSQWKSASLKGANLELADFSGSNLREADLSGINAQGAVLRGADLTGANLTGANLQKVDLNGADLKDANLTGADLRNARLGAVAHAESAIWTDVQCPGGQPSGGKPCAAALAK